ncbi:MAG: paaZ 1, partial [Rhizobacter sp.]|nr:paaZ 1 [Rhizobacter sp.]
MTTDHRYLEDLEVGERWLSQPVTLSTEDIVQFGELYDPQTLHTDPERAAAGPFRGLVASGWHLTALAMRMSVQARSFGGTPIVGVGVDELRWLKPVRPGDMLGVRAEVLSARVSQSRPSTGLVQFRFDMHDLSGTVVMSQTNFIMLGRRGHQHEATRMQAPPQDAPVAAAEPPELVPAWGQV